MSDARCYLLGNEDECSTNQVLIGWKYAFRGYVMKSWLGNIDENEKYKRINRVIVKECVSHYMKYWYERNKVYNNPQV